MCCGEGATAESKEMRQWGESRAHIVRGWPLAGARAVHSGRNREDADAERTAFGKIACFHHEAQGQLTGQSRFGKQRR